MPLDPLFFTHRRCASRRSFFLFFCLSSPFPSFALFSRLPDSSPSHSRSSSRSYPSDLARTPGDRAARFVHFSGSREAHAVPAGTATPALARAPTAFSTPRQPPFSTGSFVSIVLFFSVPCSVRSQSAAPPSCRPSSRPVGAVAEKERREGGTIVCEKREGESSDD